MPNLSTHSHRIIENSSKTSPKFHCPFAYNTTPFTLTQETAEAVEILKQKLKTPPILAHFMKDCPTEVQIDASLTGLGAILIQTQQMW